MCDAILIWRVSDLGSTVQCSTPSERANTIPIHFSFFFVSRGKARIHDFLLASDKVALWREEQRSTSVMTGSHFPSRLSSFIWRLFYSAKPGKVRSHPEELLMACAVKFITPPEVKR